MAGRASHQARTCGVLGKNMAGSGKSIEQEVLEEMDSNRSPDPAAINDKLKNFIRTRGSANQHLLLFRYLDFVPASDQGKTYRYRVRLVMQNPFYEKAREEVADPSIAIGKERETDTANRRLPFLCRRTRGSTWPALMTTSGGQTCPTWNSIFFNGSRAPGRL